MVDAGVEAAQESDRRNPFVRPARNIVLCSDGTGNSGGKGNGTNVYRMFEAIDVDGHRLRPSEIPPQIAFYDDGVGTEEFKLIKLLGGAFGWGLSRNIRDLYKLLVTNYMPGDSIYLFGFSRGAFTVRSLGGLICRVGVVNPAHAFTEDDKREILIDASRLRLLGWLRYKVLNARVDHLSRPELLDRAVRGAFRRYRRRRLREEPLTPAPLRPLFRWIAGKLLKGFDPYPPLVDETDEMRPAYYHRGVGIRCIGVWDTVGALGMPADWMRDALDYFARIDFHSTGLHPAVQAGYHALAIDDERETFHPVLWKADPPGSTRPIEQVWFAGAHSNVGGGYPKQGMANVALYWMMRCAEREGLKLYPEELDRARRAANVNDKLYDPRSGLGAYYRYKPRDLNALMTRYGAGDKPRIHASVFERIASGVEDYGPPNLTVADFDVVDDNGTCLKQAWAAEVTAYIRERRPELEALRNDTAAFVRWRRLHYTTMLVTTLAMVLGVVDLRFNVRARVAKLVGHVPADGPSTAAAQPAPAPPDAVSELVASGVRFTSDVAGLFLPEGSHRVVAPAFDYLAEHPSRFAITFAAVAILVWLRAVLRAKTDQKHVAFWEALRSKLRMGGRDDRSALNEPRAPQSGDPMPP